MNEITKYKMYDNRFKDIHLNESNLNNADKSVMFAVAKDNKE